MLVFLHLLSSDIYIYIMTPTMYFVEFITFNHCIHHISNLIKNYCRFTQNFSSHFQNSCLCGMPCTKSLPIMLALCSMLLPSYYAPNYAGIIGLRPSAIMIISTQLYGEKLQ